MFFGNSGDAMNTRTRFVRRGAALSAVLALMTAGPAALAQAVIEDSEATTPAAAALSPQAIALQGEITSQVGRKSQAYIAYEATGFRALWIDDTGKANERARALMAVLAGTVCRCP